MMYMNSLPWYLTRTRRPLVPAHGTLMPRILPPGCCAPELHMLTPLTPDPGTDRHPTPPHAIVLVQATQYYRSLRLLLCKFACLR